MYNAATVIDATAVYSISIVPAVLLNASVSNGPRNPSSPAASINVATSLISVPNKGSTTVVITGVTVDVTDTPLPFLTWKYWTPVFATKSPATA